MSYLYKCGCAGTTPRCKLHNAMHIIHSGSSTKKIVEDSQSYNKGNVFLAKKIKFDRKFDVAFLPSKKTPKDFSTNPLQMPFKIHKKIKKSLNADYQIALFCEPKDLAANLFSLECCGYKNLRVVPSIRILDDYSNNTTLDFRAFVILGGTKSTDHLDMKLIYIGHSCLFEHYILKQPWVKNVLHYDATSPRVFITNLDLKGKHVTVHTRYKELFDLIAGGRKKISYLRCNL